MWAGGAAKLASATVPAAAAHTVAVSDSANPAWECREQREAPKPGVSAVLQRRLGMRA
jgi:hypothetical protein